MPRPVDLDDELVGELEQLAARIGRPVAELLDEAVRHLLGRHRRTADGAASGLASLFGDGTLGGIDLADTAALVELLGDESL